ncbi:bifunctional folylpolyglutamate synthase/dihydrofolate synthase, partial [Sphingomonas sp.]|uniref:bifunctional folylpolyglutamate synthase/dihydrofolate synthase n=1 Tax=Sphingomonas sp. TaxID=28214 RepID=UPI0017BCFF91
HLFTSPHLVRFNERIRIAGRLIGDEALAALLTEVLDASGGTEPSFFEVATAAAFVAFARTPADACIVEVGLGGRMDATNVVERPLVCGIASLGVDHQQFLGRRLAGIAAEKAGIVKAGTPLVTQLYPPAIARRIGEVAAASSARWLPRGGPWDATVARGKLRYRDHSGSLDLPLPRLPGRHQAMNAALAIAMLRHQDALPVPAGALNAAMGWAEWPARLQCLAPGPLTRLLPRGSELWVDGGHNPSAARAIAAHARRHFAADLPLSLVFASLASKDPKATLEPFQGIAREVRTVPIADHEFRPPDELAALADTMGFDSSAHASLREALGAIRSPARVLLFGSLYLAGEALAANDQAPD